MTPSSLREHPSATQTRPGLLRKHGGADGSQLGTKHASRRAMSCRVVRAGVQVGLVFGLLIWGGCAAQQKGKPGLPLSHSIQSDQLFVKSDVRLKAEHPFIQDLIQLRQQVSTTLGLPLGTKPIHVYLFSDEQKYQQYWQANYPDYAVRRAYFVQTADRELEVFTYWSDKIQEDLRHEFTHGLLHASLETVPLWLDEGLAEYFEVVGPVPGRVNPEYVEKLGLAVKNGWRPDMPRLEKLERVSQMQRTDYREAWAWVHFLLHSSPDTKQVLVDYLQELRTQRHPRPLSERIRDELPNADERLLAYFLTLTAPGHAAVTPPP